VDKIFAYCGLVLEILLFARIINQKIYRVFPFFSAFILESFLSDGFMFFLYAHASIHVYYKFYLIDYMATSLLLFAVIVELISVVLKLYLPESYRAIWTISAFALLVIGAILWPLARFFSPINLDILGLFYYRTLAITAMLRILIFVVIAAFSRVLAIGWRYRELQIATGLGFYSIVFLAVTEFHVHQAVGPNYHFLDQLAVLSYLASLIYWLLMFGKKEPERKEFTGKMAELVLRLANKSTVDAPGVTGTSLPRSPGSEEPERR
jgi:hypothetical protein